MTEMFELTLPKLGESIVGATVVQWLKQVGDSIAVDEPLLEVSTDKVNSEIPSPVSGILREILVAVDQEIEVGAPLAKIEVRERSKVAVAAESAKPQISKETTDEKSDVFSPAVLRLAHVEGLPMETLRKIDGTGEGGRITKKDVEKFLHTKSSPCPLRSQSRKGARISRTEALSEYQKTTIDAPRIVEGEEHIQMSGMRKAIAENMVRSFYEAPHASLVTEADVTDVMKLIAREKARFKETHGVKLTITTFIIQALTKAIQQFPMLNASVVDKTIVLKRYINIGIAVNVEKGLLVPVIKNCHERNLVSIAKAVGDLSHRAREGKLAPDEMKDGTLTLTNFGMTGALIGVPIIRYPEVAIIGAGAVQKRVVVREDDSFAVRQMMYLTLTFDHRIIDGIYGCEFLAAFKHHLESVSIH